MSTVLVIDDELDIVDTLCLLLESEGYRCITAGNGLAGLKKAEEEAPDLLLVDVMMPVMDGRDLARAIKAHPTLSGTPLILMSGARGILRDADDLDYCEFLAKPFTVEEVLSVVERCLGEGGETWARPSL